MKQTVELDEEEWKQVMGIIAQAPWSIANPLLMKLGAQLQAQQTNKQTNNGQEATASQGS